MLTEARTRNRRYDMTDMMSTKKEDEAKTERKRIGGRVSTLRDHHTESI